MKSVLVTGGTGSFGKAFVKRLLATKIDRIAVLSRGEHAQEGMERELDDDRVRFFIGDVRDKDRLELAMHGMDTVIHAAALKIVPIAEYNPTECVDTNIFGAENVVKAAIRTGVQRVIALSTDKAVNPINLYGATKLAAEKIFVASNALAAGRCNFSCVRYGNVVGSRGSVIPLFKKLLAEKKPLTITDENMTRFWITMDQAIDLVLMSLRIGIERGVIYVPKIPSMKITDLADAMDPNGVRRYIGIRPGEKLHECLITEDEARCTVEYPKFYAIKPLSNKGMVGFRYTSDTNKQWLTAEQLRKLI